MNKRLQRSTGTRVANSVIKEQREQKKRLQRRNKRKQKHLERSDCNRNCKEETNNKLQLHRKQLQPTTWCQCNNNAACWTSKIGGLSSKKVFVSIVST
jgi:hypothetical protein